MWLRLSRCLSNAPQARANAAAIRFHANRADFDPIVTSARIATQKLRIIVYRVDDHIDVAVVVKISESAATEILTTTATSIWSTSPSLSKSPKAQPREAIGSEMPAPPCI